MKKFFLGTFILFDLGLIGASGFVLYQYLMRNYLYLFKPMSAGGPSAGRPVPTPAAAPGAAKPVSAPGTGASPAAGSATRKILFTYRNQRAKSVSIRADFTGWKAEAMQKGATGAWTYQAALTPGEYAYCYTVDDKTFKDPANKRTKQIGRTVVSAILVEPLTPKPPK